MRRPLFRSCATLEMTVGAHRTHTMRTAIPAEIICPLSVAGQDSDVLAAPLEYLLTSGVDPRLYLNPIHLLNGYGCRPWPRPEVFTFASSTATTISDRGFASAAAAQQQLIQSSGENGLEDACDLLAEALREQIRTALGIGAAEAEIVFSPSGTDSQLHALYVAQTMLGGPLMSVIVASDETGSGTACTATGRHFSSGTAQGAAVLKGERIIGFAEDTASIAIPLRNKDGRLRSHIAIDREVVMAVAQSVASGKRVVLHVMDRSKFGSRCPSLDCLCHIQAKWGQSVQVVVDACQMRSGRQRLKYYLTQGFMVLITGSKFFTGPPLSGALLVPAAASAVMAQIDAVPAGLQLYTNRNDWPIDWRGVRSKLPVNPNVGQLLRWVAAVEELRTYFTIPAAYRSLVLRTFARTVPRLIAAKPNLHLLPTWDGAGADRLDDEEMGVRTIFAFFVSRHGKFLSVEACGLIYRALNCDVSSLLPRWVTARQRQVAARCCHIGQPVGMPDPAGSIAGTLRISAGARVVSDSWSAAGLAASLRKLDEECEQVRTILEKIDILVENFDALGTIGEAHDMTVIREADFGRLPSRVGAKADARSQPIVSLKQPQEVNAAAIFVKPRRARPAGVRN
jgi:hypothetical protein